MNWQKVWLWGMGMAVLVTVLGLTQWPDGKLRVIGCDVGQGDATLISVGFDQVLIDAGPSNGRVFECLSQQMPFWDRTIELVIVSHPQADHIGSMDQVFERYRVGMVVAPNVAVDSEVFWRFYQGVWQSGAQRLTSARGQQLRLGEMTWEVLWPMEVISGRSIWEGEAVSEASLDVMAQDEERDVNNVSTVMQLTRGDFRALFLGDLEDEAEHELVRQGEIDKVDLVKVPHHGSKTSSSLELVSRVRPTVALIEVGEKNRYRHPDDEVIHRWENEGARVYRTDIQGMITVSSDIDTGVIETIVSGKKRS